MLEFGDLEFFVFLLESQMPVMLLLVGAGGDVSRLTVDKKMLQNIIMHLTFQFNCPL